MGLRVQLLLLLGLAAFGGTMVLSGSDDDDEGNGPETRELDEPEIVPIGPQSPGQKTLKLFRVPNLVNRSTRLQVTMLFQVLPVTTRFLLETVATLWMVARATTRSAAATMRTR